MSDISPQDETKTNMNPSEKNIDPLNGPLWDTKDQSRTADESLENLFLQVQEFSPEKKEESLQTESVALISPIFENLWDILSYAEKKGYDFCTFEPQEQEVQLSYRKQETIVESFWLKFPVYTKILLESKKIAHLVLEESKEIQEGKGKMNIGKDVYEVNVKTAPGKNGEKIWIKGKKSMIAGNSEKKKVALSTLFWFFSALLFVALIIGGLFITFVVLNATTVEDVRFFQNLWINLNDINSFIRKIVSFIFGLLLFIVTSLLAFFLFRFLITKKSLKRKKLINGIISIFLLFATFATGSAWMFIDQKIRALPNWQEQAYGEFKIFDNTLLVSGVFSREESLMGSTENLIGPVDILFDLNTFEENQMRKWLNIEKYEWSIGEERVETFDPELLRTFNQKGTYEMKVTMYALDSQWNTVTQEIANIPNIEIQALVNIQETLTQNGGKKVSFDATELKDFWNIAWYFKDFPTNENPSYKDWTKMDEGYEFIPWKVFFDGMIVGLAINTQNEENSDIKKAFIIRSGNDSEITWSIKFVQDLDNELKFKLFVENPSTAFSNGFIEKYDWTIENQTYSIPAENTDSDTESPVIFHTFSNYGEHKVQVKMTDSKWESHTIETIIPLEKKVELNSSLLFKNSAWEEIENLRYEEKTHEYYLDSFWIPNQLQIDAKLIRASNTLYSLTNVIWDINNDGNTEGNGKSFVYTVDTEGNHIISVTYTFTHRRNWDDTIQLKEFIYIEGEKKDAILDLKIDYPNNYVPITVRFDASKSYIKNDDIVKFIYDYGDGISEERDAINPGHKYTTAWDYTVILTAIGKSGKSYSLEKKLILLPAPQLVEISSSMKRAPVGQEIDFSSDKSSGQIFEYFWDFWDGEVSTEANPSHSYKKTGTYTVKLQAEFENNNSIVDEMEIEVYKAP